MAWKDLKNGKEEKMNDADSIEKEIQEENNQSENSENANNSDNSKESEQKEQTEEIKAEEDKKAEEESLQNKLVRLQADFLNYKARTEKEKIQAYGNASADVVTDLLQVVDNLERALSAEANNSSSLKEGVQMVYDQFMGILSKRGLAEIDALNKPFDANIHFGVAYDSECDAEDNTVIEVFQKGYKFNDKVIRPSMVKIAKK